MTRLMTPPASRRNPVNRKKIVGSKWTATRPVDRQKHFIVIDWVRDEDGTPTELIEIEAAGSIQFPRQTECALMAWNRPWSIMLSRPRKSLRDARGWGRRARVP